MGVSQRCLLDGGTAMKPRNRLTAALIVLLPGSALAQTSDAAYCQALTQKYQAYLGNMTGGRTPIPGPVDGMVAIEQCKAGNTAAGIPVLEQKLRDAKINLPRRG
jgi:hypothetical protein